MKWLRWTRVFLRRDVWCHAIFWGWNALFLSVVLLGLEPRWLGEILVDVWDERLPASLLLASLLVPLVPAASLLAGALWLRREPAKLFALFFGVEAPLFLLALARVFLLRELTAGLGYTLALFGAAATWYALGVFRHTPTVTRGPRAGLALAADALCLLAGTYFGALTLFYAAPLAWATVVGFCKLEWAHDLWRTAVMTRGAIVPALVLGLLLFAWSATLLLVAAPSLAVLYLRRWARGLQAMARAHGWLVPSLVTVATVGAVVLGFALANRQPQPAVLARLATPPTSDAERRALLADAASVRAGLANVYLAPYRYVLDEKDDHIREMWHALTGLDRDAGAVLEARYLTLARPLVFDGTADAAARDRAAALYERFFDEPIQKGERERILAALSATFDHDDREAGLLDAGGHKVRVARQEIAVAEHGDWAEIELHEVYENRTLEDQEVFYSFALPETAVVTGLWLGDSDDRVGRQRFVVSPRGAAQKVYRGEVARRRDPALVEQMGPRQYRLRAFPVPPRPSLRDGDRGPRQVHLWLTWRVLDDGGAWPMPELLERRNVFQDERTTRLVRGLPTRVDDAWLPRTLPATVADASMPRAHVAHMAGFVVRATPHVAARALETAGRRYAVVVDRSYSMGAHASELADGWQRLRARLAGATVDVYLTSAATRGEPPTRLDASGFDPGALVAYGGQNPGELLAQFSSLRGDTGYDAILALSDAGSLDLARDDRPAQDLGAPLVWVHLGGVPSPGYDDATLDTLARHGGGVATSLDEALDELALAQAIGPSFATAARGYVLTVERDERADVSEVDLDDGFTPIAAHALVAWIARQGDPHDVTTLATVHDLALASAIVSPWSSMIVLVSDAQRDALRRAEQDRDAFDRKVESGTERLSSPSLGIGLGDVTGTPEPEEWVLIAVAALALVAFARARVPRRAPV